MTQQKCQSTMCLCVLPGDLISVLVAGITLLQRIWVVTLHYPMSISQNKGLRYNKYPFHPTCTILYVLARLYKLMICSYLDNLTVLMNFSSSESISEQYKAKR